jgi:hypothetical protein
VPAGSAVLPELDDRELSRLRAVGRQWHGSVQDRVSWERALPVDPRLSYESEPGARRRRFVQIRSGRPDDSEDLEAISGAGAMSSGSGRLGLVVRRVLVGPVLRRPAVAEERMRKLMALPVRASDALSSVAYGPEAMLSVLVLAGSAQTAVRCAHIRGIRARAIPARNGRSGAPGSALATARQMSFRAASSLEVLVLARANA